MASGIFDHDKINWQNYLDYCNQTLSYLEDVIDMILMESYPDNNLTLFVFDPSEKYQRLLKKYNEANHNNASARYLADKNLENLEIVLAKYQIVLDLKKILDPIEIFMMDVMNSESAHPSYAVISQPIMPSTNERFYIYPDGEKYYYQMKGEDSRTYVTLPVSAHSEEKSIISQGAPKKCENPDIYRAVLNQSSQNTPLSYAQMTKAVDHKIEREKTALTASRGITKWLSEFYTNLTGKKLSQLRYIGFFFQTTTESLLISRIENAKPKLQP